MIDPRRPRPTATRRALLGSGLAVGLAACASPEQSSIANPNPSGAGGRPGTGATPTDSGTPSQPTETPTPEVLGVQRHDVGDLVSGFESLVCGPRAAVIARQGDLAIVSSVLEGPRRWSIPELTSQEPMSYASAVEMLVDSPPATSALVLARKSGSGLDSSQDVLTCFFLAHDDSEPVQGEFVVPKPEGKLVGAVMVAGVTVATIRWELDGPDYTKYEVLLRVAFDSTGKMLWQRTDENRDQDKHRTIGQSMAPRDFVALPGAVIFGVGYAMHTADIATGKTKSTVKGPWSRGLTQSEASFFTLEAYGNTPAEKGTVVYLKPSSKVLARNTASVAIDPIQDTVAIGYTVTGDDPNRAPNVDSDPAMVVLKASGGELFRLPRDKGRALGKVECLSAFDGRLVVLTQENVRILRAADGSAEPGFESIPPGEYRASSLPVEGGAYAQFLGQSSSSGDVRNVADVIVKGTPLTWEDLGVRMVE